MKIDRTTPSAPRQDRMDRIHSLDSLLGRPLPLARFLARHSRAAVPVIIALAFLVGALYSAPAGPATRAESRPVSRPASRPTSRPATKPKDPAAEKAKKKLQRKGIIAEPGVPHIAAAFPPGGRQGANLSVLIHGDELDTVSAVHFSGTGVEGKVTSSGEEGVTLSVKIGADAAPGPRDMRIIRSTGVSSRFRFFVGDLPEVNADRPWPKNHVQDLPSLPVLVNGYVMPSETHAFSFHAKKSQKIVCRVQSQEIIPLMADAVPGWPQMVLTLFDPDGREIAYMDRGSAGVDPVLVQEIPRDGPYRLEIRDSIFRGRENFLYRLSIGELPHLTGLYPLGGITGRECKVELTGVNLPASSICVTPPANGSITLPVFVKGSSCSNCLPYGILLPPPPLLAAPDPGPGRVNKPASQPSGKLISSTRPAASAPSPASQPTGVVITLPAVLDGRIARPRQEDVYAFKLAGKAELVFEVFARRLGSPLDSALTVTDAGGNRLAASDDYVDERFPLVSHQADSRISVKFPSPGWYTVRLSDAQENCSPLHAYRLSIAPPRPDFAILVLPDNPRIAPGDQTVLGVHAIRRDGCDGEIRLRLTGLPQGYTATGAVIGPKETGARFSITAPPDAAPGQLLNFGVEGETTFANGTKLVRHAMPAEQLMVAFSYVYRIPTEESLLLVTAPPTFTICVKETPNALEIPQGGEAKVIVKVDRKTKLNGQIGVGLEQPPPPAQRPLAVRYTPILPDQNEVEVTLTATRQAPVGRTLYAIVTGTSRAGGTTTVKYAPAIPVKILPPVASQPASKPANQPTSKSASAPATKPAKAAKP